MKREESFGSVVFDNNKVLIVVHNKGHIGFPKGHIEEGENGIDTAIREVKEETGIDIEIISDYNYSIEYSPKANVMKKVTYYIGKRIGGELLPQYTEVSSTYFIEKDKVLDKITYDKDKEVYKKIIDKIKEENINI